MHREKSLFLTGRAPSFHIRSVADQICEFVLAVAHLGPKRLDIVDELAPPVRLLAGVPLRQLHHFRSIVMRVAVLAQWRLLLKLVHLTGVACHRHLPFKLLLHLRMRDLQLFLDEFVRLVVHLGPDLFPDLLAFLHLLHLLLVLAVQYLQRLFQPLVLGVLLSYACRRQLHLVLDFLCLRQCVKLQPPFVAFRLQVCRNIVENGLHQLLLDLLPQRL